jgi:hypothetical protein
MFQVTKRTLTKFGSTTLGFSTKADIGGSMGAHELIWDEIVWFRCVVGNKPCKRENTLAFAGRVLSVGFSSHNDGMTHLILSGDALLLSLSSSAVIWCPLA